MSIEAPATGATISWSAIDRAGVPVSSIRRALSEPNAPVAGRRSGGRPDLGREARSGHQCHADERPGSLPGHSLGRVESSGHPTHADSELIDIAVIEREADIGKRFPLE